MSLNLQLFGNNAQQPPANPGAGLFAPRTTSFGAGAGVGAGASPKPKINVSVGIPPAYNNLGANNVNAATNPPSLFNNKPAAGGGLFHQQPAAQPGGLFGPVGGQAQPNQLQPALSFGPGGQSPQ